MYRYEVIRASGILFSRLPFPTSSSEGEIDSDWCGTRKALLNRPKVLDARARIVARDYE